MRPDELERRLWQRLDALGPAPRAELLHVLMLSDFERADRTGEFWGCPESREFAELLIDCEEDETLRAVRAAAVMERKERPQPRGSVRMATSAGVPSRLATMTNRSFSLTIASTSWMTCSWTTQNWRGSLRIPSYSSFVSPMISSHLSYPHSQTMCINELWWRDPRACSISSLICRTTASFLAIRSSLKPNAALLFSISDANPAIPRVGPVNRHLLEEGSPQARLPRAHRARRLGSHRGRGPAAGRTRRSGRCSSEECGSANAGVSCSCLRLGAAQTLVQ